MMPLFKCSIFGSLLLIAQTAAASEGAPAWLQATRELGAFGLVAFIVWWYATHVAPDSQKQFLNAISEQRTDYIAAQQAQRADYIKSRDDDRAAMVLLSTSIQRLASATETHVAQAQLVWEKQGWIRQGDQQPKV